MLQMYLRKDEKKILELYDSLAHVDWKTTTRFFLNIEVSSFLNAEKSSYYSSVANSYIIPTKHPMNLYVYKLSKDRFKK